MLFTLSTLTLALHATPLSTGGDPIATLLEESSGELIVLRPRAIINAKGEFQEGASVLIRGGKVLAAGKSIPVPPKALAIELDGVLAPGFVDAFSTNGAELGHERSRALTPELLVKDGLQPKNDVWSERLSAGVTTVHLVAEPLTAHIPGWDNGDPIHLLGGWSTVVESASLIPLRAQAQQTVGAYSGPFSSREGGASALPGVLNTLRHELPSLKAISSHGVCAWVDSAQAVKALQTLAAENDFELSLLCAGRVASYGGYLAKHEIPAGISTVNEGNIDPLDLATWSRLHKAGVAIAFGTASNDSWQSANDLRTSAIHFARVTGDSAAAMRAITTNSAKLAGLSGKVGALKPGSRADLTLWSEHPLNPSAKLQAVLIDGKTVWSATPSEL